MPTLHRPPLACQALLAALTLLSPAWAAEPEGVTDDTATTAAAAGGGLLAAASSTWRHATDTRRYLEQGHWRVAFAPAAPHFRPSPEHEHVVALAVERQRDDLWLAGFSLFSNSFGQPSAYAYLGRRHDAIGGVRPLFFQWSAGVIYGYREPYHNKVPLNVHGFSPGALVGLGWQFDRRRSAVVHLLGDAALMFQFSIDLR